jgi:methyl-accepting chemotaxis protein
MNKQPFFGKIKIGARLLFLIAVQGVVLLGVGVIAMLLLANADKTESLLSTKVEGASKLVQLTETFRNDVIDQVHAVNQGTITWVDARELIGRAEGDFGIAWENFLGGLNSSDEELINDVITPYLGDIATMFEDLKLLNAVVATTTLDQIESHEALATARAINQRYFYITVATLISGIIIAVLLGLATYYSITTPVRTVAETVQRVSEGDFSARTGLQEGDEVATLGSEFDKMLDERVANLAKAQGENERLNESVMKLLEAVYKLSQRDLTVHVPVTEDVTGPVADSLNLLTDETAKVLQGVLDISEEVATVSSGVKNHSDAVISAATLEQKEVEKTAIELAAASDSMVQIARLAQACNESAEKAISSTQTAHGTVLNTVDGITTIRDTIRETEKRIKRLGERSQEISGVVNLINSIAERTHILALNASMHAASAGEAGRGFAVVADEVQRLAENARNATSEIASLVNNIQVETNDTVTTMNEAISKVVEGTKLAERAGSEMKDTQATTAELVGMVQQIAKQSRLQAKTSNELRTRAQGIQKSSRDANAKLREQTTYTENLVVYSKRLLDAVHVFTLPEVERSAPGAKTGSVGDTLRIFPENKAAAVNA